MNIFKKLFTMLVAVLPLAATAQNLVDINFEDASAYKSVSVYDWWEASPFRTGELKGNCQVITNPFAHEPDAQNVSARVLGLQRSRFGSNLFGARIELAEDQRFELTPTVKYVHVMMRKPVAGRSMVIGLGRHNENTPGYAEVWADQKDDVEQFTALGNNKAAPDQWTDVVFPIKGAGNITIYSLVIVVDCEAPTNLTSDFLAYIDNVKVNSSKKAENAVVGDYPVCFDRDQTYTRSDRHLNSLTITTEAGTYTKQAVGKLAASEAFDGFVVAKAGETVTAKCNYQGSWMHSFFYLDTNNNGKFEVEADELVSYRNSGANDYGATHSFQIPADLQPGVYRLRGKVDWESTDPAGNDGSAGNYIIDNGGGMIDVLFLVYRPEDTTVSVSSNQRNGYVLLADGSEMSDYRHDRLTPLTVLPQGAEGFSCSGLIIRHGYNVGIVADSLQHSNPQYLATTVSHTQFAEDGTYTIPASLIDADVIIEGIMVSGTLPDGPDQPVVDPDATFPYVSPAPIGGQWAKGTKAYYIQNGAKEQAWLSLDNAREDGLRLDANEQPEDARGQWVVCGNDTDGYSFYNVSAGATQVLGLTGDDKYARVQLYEIGQEGTAQTRFDYHENGDGFSFRLHGTDYNCLNSRDQYLALWSAAAAFATDNGSRFTFYFAEDIEGVSPTPDVNTTDQFFTAQQLRDAVAAGNGVARIGILNVTTTSNKFVNGLAYNGVPASSVGTLEEVRAPQDDEIMEVIAVEGGYLLRQAEAEDGEGYLDCSAGGNFNVVGRDAALVWTLAGPGEEAYGEVTNFDDLFSDIAPEVNEHMVRFIAHGQYLNGQNQGGTGGLRPGKGAWSFNYIYNVNYDGDDVVGINTVLSPEASDAIYTLSGLRTARPVHGINIVGGRKVLR